MKRIYKFLIIIVVIFVSFGMVGCSQNGLPIEDDKDIILPLKDQTTQKEKDEVIFISIAPSGQIVSMKATNHIRNTKFSYYRDYGVFLPNGHLNISSGRAAIILEDNSALIPSLEDYDNFYYTLALDDAHYADLLPFKLKIKYNLNGHPVGYQSLIGANGNIDIEMEIIANSEAGDFFKQNYASQIQVPLSLNHAQIIEAEGSMASVITGTTVTLAYMVMPGTNAKFNIKLKATNFKFDGIQATYQPLDISDLSSSFIDIDDMGLDKFNQLSSGLDLIINEFTNVYSEANQLFVGIGMMQELTDNNELSQIQTLIDNLKSNNFKLGYRQPQSTIKLTLANRNELIEKYTNLANNIEATINKLSTEYTSIKDAINILKPKVLGVASYPEKFSKINVIINKLKEIQVKINTIDGFGELNLETLGNHKNEISTIFKEIGVSNREIQSLFQELIIDMQPLALHLEPLALDANSFQKIIDNVLLFAQSIALLQEQLTTFVDEIKLGKQQNIFSLALDPLNITDKFVSGVETGDANNPSLLSALEIILDGFRNMDFGSAGIEQFSKLYEVNPVTKIRQIDELVMGFIQMNQALAIPMENQDVSFYEGLQMMATMSDFIKLIPNSTSFAIESFLSENNLPPLSVQFIIKQQGF